MWLRADSEPNGIFFFFLVCSQNVNTEANSSKCMWWIHLWLSRSLMRILMELNMHVYTEISLEWANVCTGGSTKKLEKSKIKWNGKYWKRSRAGLSVSVTALGERIRIILFDVCLLRITDLVICLDSYIVFFIVNPAARRFVSGCRAHFTASIAYALHIWYSFSWVAWKRHGCVVRTFQMLRKYCRRL